ncbi:MAG: immunoglobulin-like domain-containing protein [Oscillospiraceae bacterium]
MKKHILSFFAGVIGTVLTLTLCVTALATNGSLDIGSAGIVFGGSPVVVSGESITAENGAEVPAVVTYTDEKGGMTNYLPIRKTAELFGTDIAWDSENQEIQLDRKILYTDLNMTITKFSNTGLTLHIENSSQQAYSYGEVYALQQKTDGRWEDYPTLDGNSLIFIMIAYSLLPGENCDWSVDWQSAYGELPSGEYRILKNLTGEDEENNWTLACNFTI